MIIMRDIRLGYVKLTMVMGVIGFFIIAASMFVFALPQLENIAVIGPGIIWVCALLASLLALDGIYKDDFDNGILEQFLLQGRGVVHIVLAKLISHWLVTGLPLLIAAPLLAVMFGFPVQELVPLLLGTIALSIISNVAASVALESNHPNVVMGILILPLYIPILIFGIHHNYMLLNAMILLLLPIMICTSRFALYTALDH
jgi:heme exporter protein B